MIDVNRAWRAGRSLVLAVLLVTVSASTAAADYDAGKRAWDAGKPGEALAQWRAAADAGDRRAMLELGRLYRMGLGAPQDYELAHMWFNLAASRGEMAALKERNSLAVKMTPQQVAEAQERARAWRPGGGGAGRPETAVAGQRATAPARSTPGPPPARAIREAQELLVALGYDAGSADGRWGVRSGKAYAAFLRDAGLPPGDTLTPEGLRAMRAMAKRQRAGTSVGADKPAEPQQPAAKPRVRLRPDALHRAAGAGDIDGLTAALKAGADVNARDRRGRTALMHAANKGYVLVVQPLLKAKADPNLRAPDGATALFMAAVHGHSETIELLMKAGADLSIRGPKGKTAVDAARARYGDAKAARKKNESPAIIALLEGKTWAQVAEEVRRQEDDAAFARADSVGTVAAYAAYLSAWPEGRHADKARRYAEEADRAAALNKEMEHRLGKTFQDCSDCPEMVVVPGGSYMMGSPADEEERSGDEGPRHRVMVPRPIAVGKYEITFGEWDACVAGGGCGGYRPGDAGWGRGRRPVVNVSWEDAKGYAEWLSRKTGEGYRLLSESEWEYVARGGTRGPFHFGETITTDQANYDGDHTYGTGRKGVDRKKTLAVGSFPANDFGLYDVHGNVWEWVEDCWHGDYTGAPADGSAWTSGGDCGSRVLRGGSWNYEPRNLRSANRDGSPPGSGTTTSVSVLPERSPHESLPLYIKRGSRGRSPLDDIS